MKINFFRKNSRKSIAINLVMAVGLVLVPFLTQAQTAKEIVETMDNKWRGDYSTQEMTMTIVRPSWERSISMKSWSRGIDYSMIFITAPAKEKGQVFMKRDKEISS